MHHYARQRWGASHFATPGAPLGSTMSSLRNAVKRPVHKERAQPASRKKLGLLEKHKDYAQRAQDYHRKQTRLRGLREKAAFKNPDEFYFGMTKAKTKVGGGRRPLSVCAGSMRSPHYVRVRAQEGVHVLDNKQELSVDLAKTLKSQDLDYVNMKRTAEKRVRVLAAHDGMPPAHRLHGCWPPAESGAVVKLAALPGCPGAQRAHHLCGLRGGSENLLCGRAL